MVRYTQLFNGALRSSLVLGLCVVLLGAFVRLSDAGLGCPDWPGCYGHFIGVPETHEEVTVATQNYLRTFEADKAWKEVSHRYLASLLGFLILLLATFAWLNRREPKQQVALPCALLVLVILQGLLGMWTVTLKLNPFVVLTHLLGGMTIMAMMWWLLLRTATWVPSWKAPPSSRLFAKVALVLLILQIALGGWTSANYASLACTDFPTCHQQYWPDIDFGSILSQEMFTNIDHEFGTLDSVARTSIHFLHRIGALIVFITLLGFFFALLRQSPPTFIAKTIAVSVLFLLLQVSLGISNIIFSLPIAVATAHNGVAVLLLLSLLTLVFQIRKSHA